MNMVTVNLDRPIATAQIFGQEDDQMILQAAEDQAKAILDAEMQKIEVEKSRILQLISAVEAAASEIDGLRKNAIKENNEQIALLAVEIARKILASEIEEGKYDIAAIIEKSLQAAPSREGATIRLSPDDHATVEELIKSGNGSFEGITFEPDSSILPANCFVSTSKGVVEYFINDQLSSIGEMLAG